MLDRPSTLQNFPYTAGIQAVRDTLASSAITVDASIPTQYCGGMGGLIPMQPSMTDLCLQSNMFLVGTKGVTP